MTIQSTQTVKERKRKKRKWVDKVVYSECKESSCIVWDQTQRDAGQSTG